MDCIERSNLSRQLLFRNKDINEFKSVMVVRAATEMNERMKAVPY